MDVVVAAVGGAGSIGAGLAAGALFAKLHGKSGKRPLSTVELRFGSDLTREAVEALLAAVSGLPRRASVVLETFATEDEITHSLVAEQAPLDNVCGQLRGLIPDLRIEPVKARANPTWQMGARLSWSHAHVLLRTDGIDEAAAGMLAAFYPLAKDEAVLLRVELQPGHPTPLPQQNGSAARQTRAGFPIVLFARGESYDAERV